MPIDNTTVWPQSTIWPIAFVILSISGFAYALGLTYPVVSLILEARGFSEAEIGLNATMAGLGIFVSSPIMPKLAGRLGYRLLIAYSALGSAVLVAAMALFDSYAAWSLIRFFMSILVTGLFVGGESWLNELSEDRYRGRVMGIYAMVTAGGFAAGPFSLGFVGTGTVLPFMLCAAVLLVCAAAVAPLARVDVKPSDHLTFLESLKNLPRVAAMIPTLTFAIAAMAVFEGTSHSLFPVYFKALGFTDAEIGFFIGLIFTGAIPIMPLMGWLADRGDTNWMLVVLAVLTCIFSIGFLWMDFRSWAAYPFLIGLGGIVFGTYTLALTEIGHRFKGATLITAMAGASVGWGAGSMIGPVTTGWAMKQFGNNALPISFAILYAMLIVVALTRRGRKLTGA